MSVRVKDFLHILERGIINMCSRHSFEKEVARKSKKHFYFECCWKLNEVSCEWFRLDGCRASVFLRNSLKADWSRSHTLLKFSSFSTFCFKKSSKDFLNLFRENCYLAFCAFHPTLQIGLVQLRAICINLQQWTDFQVERISFCLSCCSKAKLPRFPYSIICFSRQPKFYSNPCLRRSRFTPIEAWQLKIDALSRSFVPHFATSN